jgi:uncharacterized RDD family membrane protein YckC
MTSAIARPRKTGTLALRTPEGVVFSLPLAGPVSRFLALGIDIACIMAGAEILRQLLGSVRAFGAGQALFAIASFILSVGYGIALEWWWRGQTIGKRVMGLRVMDEHALGLEFSQVVVRNLLRFIDGLPLFYLVGGACCFFSKRSQRLGDLAANTIVVRDLKPPQPDLEQLRGGRYNSMLEHRHLAARLRQRVPPQAAAIALESILRRDQFEPRARVELFGDLAAYFRNLVEFPPEAVEQLSDEQYVRNVAEILFTSRQQRA